MIEQRDGSGILFKNDRKTAESHPGYTGTITIKGEQFDLSAWIKQGAKTKFMSLSARPKSADGRREHHSTQRRGTDQHKIDRTERVRGRVMF